MFNKTSAVDTLGLRTSAWIEKVQRCLHTHSCERYVEERDEKKVRTAQASFKEPTPTPTHASILRTPTTKNQNVRQVVDVDPNAASPVRRIAWGILAVVIQIAFGKRPQTIPRPELLFIPHHLQRLSKLDRISWHQPQQHREQADVTSMLHETVAQLFRSKPLTLHQSTPPVAKLPLKFGELGRRAF